MKTSSIVWILVVVVVIVGGVLLWMNYSSNDYGTPAVSPTSTTDSTSSNTPSGTGGVVPLVLNTGSNATLGNYLVAANGMTLYLYTKDTTGVSNCTGQCAAIWPPYTVTSAASLPGGVNVTGAISTITRADGSLQVAYNGKPLYFYDKDTNPGDTTGQNVGGVWFVVAP